MNDIEKRCVDVELRTEQLDGQSPTLVGYAAVFDSLSEDLGGFREQIMPGAFRRSLAGGPDVKALFNHDPNQVLGRTRSGTLTLQEDTRGLRVEIALPETTLGRDIYALVQRGDINQMSFAFRVRPGGEKWDRNIRTLSDVDLFDVSPVTDPAYRATVVSARALEQAKEAAVVPENETNGQEPEAIDELVVDDTQARLSVLAQSIQLRQRR